MSELFLFGDRVWFYAGLGVCGREPEPEQLREGLVVGTFVKQEISALDGTVTTVPRVHVAYAEGPSPGSTSTAMQAHTTHVPAEWVFRCREDAAVWAQDRIDQRVVGIMDLHARWGEMRKGAPKAEG